jgi:hypothetical protein
MKEEEEQVKIQEASEEKKRDAARLKAAKATKKAAKKNVNAHLTDLSTFNKENEEEKDGTSKTLFDKEAGSNSPCEKKEQNKI